MQECPDSLCPGFGMEAAAQIVAPVLLMRQSLIWLETAVARLDNDIEFIVHDFLNLSGRQSNYPGKNVFGSLVIPDMDNGRCKGYVAEPSPSLHGVQQPDSAGPAYGTAGSLAIVLAAGTFTFFQRAENSFAEQPIFYRLTGPYVKRFRRRHLAV